jgi:riboflavin biosynthesis pyrimidine reductase
VVSGSDWEERFSRLVARKTRKAIGARLPPYATELEHPGATARAIGNGWSMQIFDGLFYMTPPRVAGRPACSLVFVQSADGNTGAANPGTLGGGDTDKHLVYEGLSRVAADAVLAGAETVRGTELVFSVWHPELIALRLALGLPRHPAQAVATVRGVDLDQSLLFNVPEVRVFLLTVGVALTRMRDGLAARPWITPVVLDAPEDLRAGFGQLASMGVGILSCIGGRTLGSRLLDAHLVDDVYLTTSARTGGQPDTPLHRGQWRGPTVVRKRGTAEETGVMFEHILPVR